MSKADSETTLPEKSVQFLDYLSSVPQSVPSGKIVAHNTVRHTRRLGSRGFRAWLAESSSEYEVCPCKWAPELGVHYTIKRRRRV